MTIDLTIGMEDHAVFTPALNSNFARFAAGNSTNQHRALPNGGSAAQLNYLDRTSPFFHYHAGLYSAAFGVYDNAPTVVSRRDRRRTIMIGDSGGYSAISGALSEPFSAFRRKSLNWLEAQCDVGLILDDPTRSLDVAGGTSKRFQDCLDTTIESIKFAIDHRSSDDLRLLTVMQGRNAKEAQIWAAAVEPYQRHFEGVALAGDTKLDLALWCKQLIGMRDAGVLDRLGWIHVLGTTRPGFGVMLTGLQRALRKHMNASITISYDSSLAFRIVQANKQITTGIAYDREQMNFLRYQFPDHWSGLDRNARFPFSSPLGDICRIGDFNPANHNSVTGWDTLGLQMLTNHEVFKELTALREANLLALAEATDRGQTPWHIRKAWEGFDKIFGSTTPMAEITKYKRFLAHYAGGSAVMDDDAR
ncbi:hypothetical protein [Aliihoeflea sp. 2WW]|uniref:hypothetical protein n=1 Tax=Aliihoeflea sp. 2WW TaxID=1381123 RepID=UPI0004660718|nr:hypothetical protein [Aliihoeflea sp. 2WW]